MSCILEDQDLPQSKERLLVEQDEKWHSQIRLQVPHLLASQDQASEAGRAILAFAYTEVEVEIHHDELYDRFA